MSVVTAGSRNRAEVHGESVTSQNEKLLCVAMRGSSKWDARGAVGAWGLALQAISETSDFTL